MRIGYVLNKYPAISNTFILREVVALRRLGVQVETVSVHRPTTGELLALVDREESATTTYVLPLKPSVMLRAHVRALRRGAGAYFSTLRRAIASGERSGRGRLWQVFYFAEAMVAWDRFSRSGIRHLHAHFSYVACDVARIAAHFGTATDSQPWTYSFTVHGSDEFYDLPRNRMPDKAREASLVIGISYFARSQVLGMLHEDEWRKVRIVHCGIEPERYDMRAIESRASTDPFRILMVGRLVPAKGHAVLLEAAARLAAEGLDVRLDLVGDGPERETLERIAARLSIEDRVTFAGAVGQDEINEHYRLADVFCLPSFAEGLPVVIMEAMAQGLPVVSSAIMGIPEIVEDGMTGLLVRPGDADGLTAALRRLAEDDDARRRLADAARHRVLEEFDVNASAAELAAHFAAFGATDPLPGTLAAVTERHHSVA